MTAPRLRVRSVLALAAALALAACASEPRRDFHGRRGERAPGEMRARTRLFVSPSGEPFRGPDGLGVWFAGADADHDGAITRAEFEADAERFFKRLDVNGDGVIDGFEMQAYEKTIVPEIADLGLDENPRIEGGERRAGGGMAGGGRRGGGRRAGGGGVGMAPPTGGAPRGAGREGAARFSLINEPEPVANADENVDGRVSLAEWRRATERRFQALDKAKTGRLTLDQLGGKAPPPPPTR